MKLVACAVVLCGCDVVFGLGDVKLDAPREIDAAIDAAPSSCPSTYTTIEGLTSLYRYGTGASWLDAELDCERDNAHLVVLNSSSEAAAVRFLLDELENVTYNFGQQQLAQGYVWVGLSDLASSDAACSDGTQFQWVTTEPAISTTPFISPPWFDDMDPRSPCNQRCVRFLQNDSRITNVACSNALPVPYVCECDGLVADSSRY